MVTIHSTSVNIRNFYTILTVWNSTVGFLWISEQNTIISAYRSNRYLFIAGTDCDYCALRTECADIFQVNFVSKRLRSAHESQKPLTAGRTDRQCLDLFHYSGSVYRAIRSLLTTHQLKNEWCIFFTVYLKKPPVSQIIGSLILWRLHSRSMRYAERNHSELI